MARLKEVMNQTNIPSKKSTQHKPETIFSVLGKEFALMHQVKYKIPINENYDELTEVYIKAEGFTTIHEPAVDTWQRCTHYASMLAISSATIAPPASATDLTPSHHWRLLTHDLALVAFSFYFYFYFQILSEIHIPLLHLRSIRTILIFCFETAMSPIVNDEKRSTSSWIFLF